MAKVVVTKSKLDSLAQHINTKAGTTGAKTIAQMQATVDGISTKMSVTWHQCPAAVRNYLANVTYDPSDYSNSQIADYAPATPVASNTKPIGKTVGGVTYYNEVPNVETPFSADSAAGTLKPLDALRWINTTHAPNVRDLGGWACDGGKVKYGMMFRGGDIDATDRNVLVSQCGVRAELNLRGKNEADYTPPTSSVLGTDIMYYIPDIYQWYSIANKTVWRGMLRFAFDCVLHNQTVYFHCAAGADRTATFACVIEALLGVSQSDIDKDYELTCFYTGTGTDALARRRNESDWTELINQINALPGSTFRDKVVGWVATLGFTAAEINAFRAAMIGGTPGTVTPDIGTYTVTNTLTNATSDNNAVSATEYQPYTAKISPANGYVVSSVQVKMGGADVTGSVWRGTQTVLRRKVTVSLTHCTSDNGKVAVIDGQGYAATLTAAEGYTLDGATISILMGGVDVSTYFKGGVIAIPNVTGDLEITVTAVKQAAGYTNLADPSSADWLTNKRWGSSGSISDSPGHSCSNYVAIAAGDVIRFKGIDFTAVNNNARVALTTGTAMNPLKTQYVSVWNTASAVCASLMDASYDEGEDCWKFTVKTLQAEGKTYDHIRWYFPTPSDLSTIIITRNEVIE